MPSLAITGTLGSGKSILLRELSDHLTQRGFRVTSYSADDANRRLLEADDAVCKEIASVLGKQCLDPQGRPDRIKLSALVSTDQGARKILEGIMHPRLESFWRPLAEKHRGEKTPFFVAEIPLLYEKALSGYFDSVFVIGCSDIIRRSRLESQRSISREQADRWLAIQQSQDRKIALADHLFWNDGLPESIKLQLSQFLRYLAIQ